MSLYQTMSLQKVHDALLEMRPEGASCPDDCPYCNKEVASELSPQGGNHVSDKTYTDDEVQALVANAVAKATQELQSELNEHRSAEESAALDAKISEAKAEVEAEVAELQAKLDEAIATSTQATKERDEIVAWLENAKSEAEQAELIEARRDDRVKQVAEVIDFPEEHVAERAVEWASMEDEKFEALLADYKALATKIGSKPTEQGPPRMTAMHATRETGSPTRKVGSAVSEVIGLYKLGVDPRSVR